jgi:large subunit ribosomal protein L18
MKSATEKKSAQRARRHNRIRAKVNGTEAMPRLSVYKSNKYVYAQLIDDEKGNTIVAASTKDVKTKAKGMLEKAKQAGIELAKLAGTKNIKKVVFDRGGFIYTGRVKALAEGAREGGLQF